MAQELPEGTVTILFTDVEGSTDLTTRVGDEAARELLRACDALARQQVARHRGQEVKGMGDGLMVAFTSARRAVACAIDIQKATAMRSRRQPERSVRVRIGLNTGEVFREERDLFGATVTAARRITDYADAGDILVSDSVRSVLGAATTFQLEDQGEVSLKGFPVPVRLFRVSWEEEAARTSVLSRPERTPFVGREAERADLRRLLDQAARGEGALVLISGDPGVGKTRLTEEITLEARQAGVLTWIGHCYEMEGASPYIPVVEILEAAARTIPAQALSEALGHGAPAVAKLVPELHRLIPGIPQPLDMEPERERRDLFNALGEFMERASRHQPLLLVLEDLQWADSSTLLLIQHVAPWLGEVSVLILGTYREVELEQDHPLTRTLEWLLRQRCVYRLAVKPLDEADVSAMLRALSGLEPPTPLTRAIYTHTDGNPFFVEEVFKHLAEEGKLFDDEGHWHADLRLGELAVPETVRLITGRRLRRVSEECRRALAAAAVIGRAFSFDLLEALIEADTDVLLDAIDECEQARIIVSISHPGESRFTFTHELIRQTLVGDLSMPRRRRLHLRVAEAIEQVYAGALDEHASELAHHYRSAGELADAGRVVATSEAAGDLALGVKAYPEAELHYRAALRAASAAPGAAVDERARILHKLGQIHRGQGRWDEALDAYDQAIDLYGSIGSGKVPAAVLLSKADAHGFRPLPQPREALEALSAAKNVAGSDKSLLARINEMEAQHLVQLRRYSQAGVAVAEALALAEKIGSSVLIARARCASGFYHLCTLDMQRALEDYLRAIEVGVSTPYQQMAAQSRCAFALACMGRLDEAAERAALAQRFFRYIEDPSMHPEAKYLIGQRDPVEYGYSCVPMAMTVLIRGHFDEAQQFMTRAMEESGDPPNIWVTMALLPLMVALYYHLGRFGEAEELLQRFVVSQLGAQTRLPASANDYRALLQAAQGADPNSVVDSLAPVSTRFSPDVRSLPVHVLTAETGVLLRHTPLAEGQYEPLRDVWERGVVFALPWVALLPRLLGAICVLCERWGEAESHLTDALEVAQTAQALPELALTHLEFADLCCNLPGERNRTEGLFHLAEARRLLSDLGMVVWRSRAERVEERLVRSTARPSWRDALTEAEVVLLRRLAEGRSNQEMAQILGLSPRTVARQLSQLYKKIGVGGRAGAISYAFREGVAGKEGS